MDIQNYANKLLQKAVKEQVHDIYVLPVKEGYQLTFRMSQRRKAGQVLQFEEGEKLILHFKFRASMNIGEKRRAQLGSFSEKQTRFRLSTVGDFQGKESLVIRILYPPLQENFQYFFEEQ
jgi:competence protein ComGA